MMLITEFNIFKKNLSTKKYVIILKDPFSVLCKNLNRDTFSYIENNINNLQIFSDEKSAERKIKKLKVRFKLSQMISKNSIEKTEFEIMSLDNFELLLNANKYNI